ncbi:CBN-DDL-1 protein [Caenorhabditis brenneri]|uniref:CBN-DDL-1 protein n=1 Tax=Caenorhabditis brenneri TaxID=135651 RepID=G0NAV6_CAEBE|nr:CBN-DDL-1 protein [Caenorhabditis brenneri]
MTEILNNFGNQMEDVLEKAEQSLDVADRKLRLMEAKLSSVQLEKEQHFPTVSNNIITSKESDPQPQPSSSTPSSDPPVIEAAPVVTAELASSVVLIKNDPTYSKYFKMLKMGVPEAGVIQKMESEGVDPSILVRGDEPSNVQVPKSSGYESSGESVSSFSDSD